MRKKFFTIIIALWALGMLVLYIAGYTKIVREEKRRPRGPWPDISKPELEERTYLRMVRDCTNGSRPPCPTEWFIPWEYQKQLYNWKPGKD